MAGENFIMKRNFDISLDDQISKDEMGRGPSSTHGSSGQCPQSFAKKTWRKSAIFCRPRHRLADDIEIESGVCGLLFGRASEVLGTCMYTVPPIASSYPTDHSTLRLPS